MTYSELLDVLLKLEYEQLNKNVVVGIDNGDGPCYNIITKVIDADADHILDMDHPILVAEPAD